MSLIMLHVPYVRSVLTMRNMQDSIQYSTYKMKGMKKIYEKNTQSQEKHTFAFEYSRRIANKQIRNTQNTMCVCKCWYLKRFWSLQHTSKTT